MQSFLTPRRLLILVIVLLAVSSLLPGRRATALAKPLRVIVETFATPIRYPLHALGAAVRSQGPRDLGLTEPTDRGQERRYFAALQDEVDKLREEVRQLRRVRSIVGEASPMAQVDAPVTGVTGPRDAPVLRIDRGSTSRVIKGRIVVSGYHLVGEIAVADPLTAQVKTITSAKTKLLARLLAPDEATLREGPGIWLSWSPDHQAFVQQVSTVLNVREGDFAVLADEGWAPEARGFFLGQVTAVDPYDQDPLNYLQVVVQPTFKLDHLRRVTVLVPVEVGN